MLTTITILRCYGMACGCVDVCMGRSSQLKDNYSYYRVVSEPIAQERSINTSLDEWSNTQMPLG
jgi:hypothetical protein